MQATIKEKRRIQWGTGHIPRQSVYESRLIVTFNDDHGVFRAGDFCAAFTKAEAGRLWERVRHLDPKVVKDQDDITAVTAT